MKDKTLSTVIIQLIIAAVLTLVGYVSSYYLVWLTADPGLVNVLVIGFFSVICLVFLILIAKATIDFLKAYIKIYKDVQKNLFEGRVFFKMNNEEKKRFNKEVENGLKNMRVITFNQLITMFFFLTCSSATVLGIWVDRDMAYSEQWGECLVAGGSLKKRALYTKYGMFITNCERKVYFTEKDGEQCFSSIKFDDDITKSENFEAHCATVTAVVYDEKGNRIINLPERIGVYYEVYAEPKNYYQYNNDRYKRESDVEDVIAHQYLSEHDITVVRCSLE